MDEQKIEQRKVAIVTSLGKKYSGFVDIPNAALRTTDLFNSSNLFWRNPAEKCYDNAILMYNVNLILDDNAIYKKFDRIQIKLNEILFFYDDFEAIGDEREKKRAISMAEKTQEKPQTVNLITKMVSHSFYDITGSFYGLFKKKSNDKFLPLTAVTIVEISKKDNKWFRKEINLPHKFVGIGNYHVEAATLG